jgi:hypothetical protein
MAPSSPPRSKTQPSSAGLNEIHIAIISLVEPIKRGAPLEPALAAAKNARRDEQLVAFFGAEAGAGEIALRASKAELTADFAGVGKRYSEIEAFVDAVVAVLALIDGAFEGVEAGEKSEANAWRLKAGGAIGPTLGGRLDIVERHGRRSAW